MKRKLLSALLVLTLCLGFAGCGSTSDGTPAGSSASSVISTEAEVNNGQIQNLEGHTLHIYCGAGMTKPFQAIADVFKEQSGCNMEITFANAGQIQTQINTSQEGDLFIAGSAEELKPVEGVVSSQVNLVKHIPVIAVQKGNPKDISGLADLAENDLRVVLGDSASTPIGKVSDKALTDAGILDQVNVVARTATAPAIYNALAADECDAAIIWKENVGEGTEVVETPDMEPYIKTIPAASLNSCADQEALDVFIAFLNTDAAKNVWKNAGYEVLN